MLSEEDWFKLAIGWHDTKVVRVFHIDPVISVQLGVATTAVHIAPQYIQKIRFKHKINPDLFQQMIHACQYGAAHLDTKPNRHAHALICHEIGGRHFQLVLKGIPDQNEIWLTSYYYIRQSRVARIAKTLPKIR